MLKPKSLPKLEILSYYKKTPVTSLTDELYFFNLLRDHENVFTADSQPPLDLDDNRKRSMHDPDLALIPQNDKKDDKSSSSTPRSSRANSTLFTPKSKRDSITVLYYDTNNLHYYSHLICKNPFKAFCALNNVRSDKREWFYTDENKNIQGPFSSLEMDNWFNVGFFFDELEVSFNNKDHFFPLYNLVSNYGRPPHEKFANSNGESSSKIGFAMRFSASSSSRSSEEKHTPKRYSDSAIVSYRSREIVKKIFNKCQFF